MIEDARLNLEATTHLRLNVGSGDTRLQFFTALDCNPECHPDIIAHVPPLPFQDGSLHEIWACHFLEHLEREQAVEFLQECHRCLVPKGRLGLVVPDTRVIMERWIAGDNTMMPMGPDGAWWPLADLDVICHLFLYASVRETEDYHKWSYDQTTLARAMTQAGFENLREINRYRDLRLASPVWFQCGVDGFKA